MKNIFFCQIRMRGFQRIYGLFLLVFLISAFIIPLNNVKAIGAGGISAYPANPDPENSLTKSWFIYELLPGESFDDILVINNNSEEEEIVKIYVVDSMLNNVGGFSLEAEDDSKDEIGKWIELEMSEIILQPGEGQKVNFKITIPDDASVGEHSGGIIIQKGLSEEQKNTEGGFVITTRMGVRVYQTVPGDIIKDLDFSNFSLTQDKENKKYIISAGIVNKGNVSVEPKVKIFIKDLFFNKQSKELVANPIVPRDSQINSKFEFSEPKFGKFEVEAVLNYEDANEQARSLSYPQKLYFWVIPWNEIFIVLIIIFLNSLFFGINYILKKRKIKNMIDYKVGDGEDLESVALKFKMKWQELAKINKIKAPFKVEFGQSLLVKGLKLKVESEDKSSDAEAMGDGQDDNGGGECIVGRFLTEKSLFLIIVLIIFVVLEGAVLVLKLNCQECKTVENNIIPVCDDVVVDEIKINSASSSLEIASSTKNMTTTTEDVIEIDKTVAITILNGSGIKGAANDAYIKLEDEFYENLDTGNADSFNYEGVIVQCASSTDEVTCLDIQEILLEDNDDIQMEDGDVQDIVIIIGK